MTKTKLTVWLVIVLLVGGAIGYFSRGVSPSGIVKGVTNIDNIGTQSIQLGSTCNNGLSYTGCTTEAAPVGGISANSTIYAGSGLFEGGINSTTTPASMTMKTSDFNVSSLLSITPTVGAVTLTLPSTTTDPTFLPNPGDCTWDMVYNATTSAVGVITFSGGSTASGGYILQAASSTGTAIAPEYLVAGTSAEIRFCRRADTDILTLFVPFHS